MPEDSITSVGLGGDGDEIYAIADVESAFGVKLDYSDAEGWRTAGDVFAALQAALPEQERKRPDVWTRFAVALCGQTGVNPNDIGIDSPLLSDTRLWAWLADVSAIGWIVVAAILLAAAILASG